MRPTALLIIAGITSTAQADVGAIRCYELATNEGLEENKAVQLCLGAESPAPAQCFAAVMDQVTTLTDLEAVRLCRGAPSIAPATCFARLEDATMLERAEIVSYCAAQRWPLIPSPDPGTPACVEAALDRTTLVEAEAVRLCRGSETTAPVDCYEAGDDATLLTDRPLIDLCARMVPVPHWSRWW